MYNDNTAKSLIENNLLTKLEDKNENNSTYLKNPKV